MEVMKLPFGFHRFRSLATLVPVFFWKDYYFFYNHRLLFIGLLFSRCLTRNAIVSALTWYLTSNGGGVMWSAILTNVQGSLSSIFEIITDHAAYSFIGRFPTLVLSTIAYITALVLFWKFPDPYDVIWVLVVTLILLAFGTSGDGLLEDLLLHFEHDIDTLNGPNKKQLIACATIWIYVAYVSSALIAILWVAPDAIGGVHPSWKSSFLICLIIMVLGLVIFGVGHIIVYHRGDLTVEVFFGVFQACLKKLLKYISWCLPGYSRHVSPTNVDPEMGDNERIALEIATLHLDTERKEDNTNISYKQKGYKLVLKSLFDMLPIWVVFFGVSIISATGSAFFFLQYNNLNPNNDVAVQIYSLVQDSSRFVIPFLYRWICHLRLPKNEKVKIGVGIIFGVGSCICAWQLEVRRLKEVSHLVASGYEEDLNTSISFLWLVPQFCLLGCMEGLTEEGLSRFYMLRMNEQYLQRYREGYIALVMGIGKAQNIVLILICKGWFGDTVNRSRLDKYYMVLVCYGSANFIFYCFIARFFYKVTELGNKLDDELGDELGNAVENIDIENLQQEHFIEQIRDINEQNQDLAEDDKLDDQKQDL